jgi:hypothetical protein
MALFGKKPTGRLKVEVDYTTRHNFSLTVAIRELKLSEPITFAGKTFEVPAGSYTVALKGLMHDASHEGSFHSVYRGVYGTFERSQKVDVVAGKLATCHFELPKDKIPVMINVVSGDVPIVGASVLIKSVDPNSRVTRKEGVQFQLEEGTYQVVVSHGNILMTEAIHVTDQETEFFMDISQQMAIRTGLVVVRYRDGKMVKGTTDDFAPGVERFTVEQHNGQRVPIDGYGGMKAVFFVKTLDGNRLYDERKDFAISNQFGRKTVVSFYDKEEIAGYTMPGHTTQPQFFLFPVDPKSNNAKVYVVKEATTSIRVA